MGHVIRTMALADHLKNGYGCTIHFAMRKSILGINRVKEKYSVIQSNEIYFDYSKWLSDCIISTQSGILVMDVRDGLTREELRSIKYQTNCLVVTLDDPEEKRLESDLAFYPPVPQLKYLSWVGFEGALYIGWQYAILRREFSKVFPEPHNSIPNIFISMGGSDESNMVEVVVNALKTISNNFKANIMIGEGYQYWDQLVKSLKKVPFQSKIYRNPHNVAEIMSKSDLALISFGQTAYELTSQGIATVYLCISEDHENSAQLFVNEGIGLSLGQVSENTQVDISETVAGLLENRSNILEMSRRAKLLQISNLDKIAKCILEKKI